MYARLDAIVNGNGGGGSANGGADSGVVTASGVPVVSDPHTVSQATNRDYAVPTSMALTADRQGQASVGYADTASDGLTSLDASHTPHAVLQRAGRPRRRDRAGHAQPGHARVHARRSASAASQDAAVSTARASLRRVVHRHRACVRQDLEVVRRVACGSRAGSPAAQTDAYWLSANVVRASVDKTFPGAIAAGLASPWGQAVSAGDLPGGKPVYFGSYREVFARDLYEAVTGLLAVGDVATARDATRFLFERQQQPPATCRATRCSTARPPPTPAASSSTRRRTRS